MEKTRRERRAEAVERLNALTRERRDYKASDILAYTLYGGHEEDYCESTDDEDLRKLIDLLSEDECHKEAKGGGYKFCSVCGYNITSSWAHWCPNCGCKVRDE